MDTLSYKTPTLGPDKIEREWLLIDAEGLVLGRLCAEVAKILRGKNKPCFSPNIDCGDNVVIVNADKIILTGKKMTDRVYYRFSGYPGGQKAFSPETLMQKSYNKHIKAGMHPLFLKVIKGMLPKNRLGRALIKNVHVYNGPEHPHEAQQPRKLDLSRLK